MMTNEIAQAAAVSHAGLTRAPIFVRSLVNLTRGTIANGSWRLRITWLRMSSFAVPLAP